jgi:hypothetical protein
MRAFSDLRRLMIQPLLYGTNSCGILNKVTELI